MLTLILRHAAVPLPVIKEAGIVGLSRQIFTNRLLITEEFPETHPVGPSDPPPPSPPLPTA